MYLQHKGRLLLTNYKCSLSLLNQIHSYLDPIYEKEEKHCIQKSQKFSSLSEINENNSFFSGKMSDLKSKFLDVYKILKSELLNDPDFEFTDDGRQWVERVILNFFFFSLILLFSRCLHVRFEIMIYNIDSYYVK